MGTSNRPDRMLCVCDVDGLKKLNNNIHYRVVYTGTGAVVVV